MKSFRGLKIFQWEMLPFRMEIGRRAHGEVGGGFGVPVNGQQRMVRDEIRQTTEKTSFRLWQ